MGNHLNFKDNSKENISKESFLEMLGVKSQLFSVKTRNDI